jgi:hypothetical protein
MLASKKTFLIGTALLALALGSSGCSFSIGSDDDDDGSTSCSTSSVHEESYARVYSRPAYTPPCNAYTSNPDKHGH